MVRRTMAEEDRIAERKRTLIEQLLLRFKSLSPETEQVIEATQDGDQLVEWLRRFATAKDLDSIGIVSSR